MFLYRVFGLIVASELELPEVGEYEETVGQAEVEICISKMPEHILEAKRKGYHSGFKGKEYSWLHFIKEGDYYIHEGKKIDIDLGEVTTLEDMVNVRQTILGRCFGEILFQLDRIAVHGSAICDQNYAYIISGRSGSGKSTLTNEMIRRGYYFMADDTVPIHRKNGGTYVSAGYPQQKVCLDLAQRLGYQVENMILLNEERQKYAISMREHYVEEEMPLAGMIVLEESETEEVEMMELQGGDKLQCFLHNLYCIQKYTYTNINPELFKECMEVLSEIKIRRIRRPKGKDSVESIAGKILEIV